MRVAGGLSTFLAFLSIANANANASPDQVQFPPHQPRDAHVLKAYRTTRGYDKRGDHSCGPILSRRTRIHVIANEAAHAWDTSRVLSPMDYWEHTPENINESGPIEFWGEFKCRSGNREYPECHNRNMTEIQCFAAKWWGDFDYGCSIDQLERCLQPTKEDIASWIQKTNPSWPPHRVVDVTRKVYFTHRHFQSMASDMGSDWVLMSRLASHISLEAGNLLSKFTPQHDQHQAARCQFVKDVAEIVFDVAFQGGVVFFNTGAFNGPIAILAERSETLAKEAIKKTATKAQKFKSALVAQQLVLARQSAYYTQWGAGEGRKAGQGARKLYNSRYREKESSVKDRFTPRLEFPMIKGHGFCGVVMGVTDDNSGPQTVELIKFILETLGAMRETLSDLFDSFFIKDKDGLGKAMMKAVMEDMDWIRGSSRNVAEIEAKMKKSIESGLMTALLASSRQYIKCEIRDDAAEVCKQDLATLDPVVLKSMFCPANHPNVRCQAALWTKKKLFNHDKFIVPLDGKDIFDQQGIDRIQLFQNSIDRYFALGKDSYTSRPVIVDGKMEEPHKMAHMAVSMSKVRTVNPGKRHLDFPFSNGDWTSNLTPAFLHYIRVNITDEWEMRRQPLHKHLKSIPEPANRFFLLCNLEVRWPNSGERTASLVNSGASPLCDTVRSKIGHMDELEGNYRFCRMPEVKKILFKHEKSLSASSHSHRKLCRTWFDSKSIEIQQRFGNEKGHKEEHIGEDGDQDAHKKEHLEEEGKEEVHEKEDLEEQGHDEVKEKNREEETKHGEEKYHN